MTHLVKEHLKELLLGVEEISAKYPSDDGITEARIFVKGKVREILLHYNIEHLDDLFSEAVNAISK